MKPNRAYPVEAKYKGKERSNQLPKTIAKLPHAYRCYMPLPQGRHSTGRYIVQKNITYILCSTGSKHTAKAKSNIVHYTLRHNNIVIKILVMAVLDGHLLSVHDLVFPGKP